MHYPWAMPTMGYILHWYACSLGRQCSVCMMLISGHWIVADLLIASWELCRRISRWTDVTITLLLPCSRISSLISEVKGKISLKNNRAYSTKAKLTVNWCVRKILNYIRRQPIHWFGWFICAGMMFYKLLLSEEFGSESHTEMYFCDQWIDTCRCYKPNRAHLLCSDRLSRSQECWTKKSLPSPGKTPKSLQFIVHLLYNNLIMLQLHPLT